MVMEMEKTYYHKKLTQYLFAALLLLIGMPASGLTFNLSPKGDIVGKVQTAYVRKGENLADIGRRFDIGVYEMLEANPHIDPWEPETGSAVIIPTRFILPPGPKEGLVLNLAEMRMYFYHKNADKVSTFPMGIGRVGWLTPMGSTKVISKAKNPTWYPPKSIRANYERLGKYLPSKVPPGPNNPLGNFAMRLGWTSILIHGTNQPGGVGVRSSNGCIRMLPEDIDFLFYQMGIGTKVTVINQPYKVASFDGELYMEAHDPLTDEYYVEQATEEDNLVNIIEGAAHHHANITWEGAELAARQALGYPVKIN